MTAIIPVCSAPVISSASNVGVGSGGSATMPCQPDTPRAMPVAVTPRMPMSTAVLATCPVHPHNKGFRLRAVSLC